MELRPVGRDPVLVAVDESKIRLLKSRLNGEGERIRFVDMREAGRNPAVIISIWKDFVAKSAANGSGCKGIGEPVWPGRSDPELAECEHHESLVNLAFEGGPGWRLTCPYDAGNLRPQALAGARHNHPTVGEERERHSSDSYLDPMVTRAPFTGALPPPPASADSMRFESPADLEVSRRFVAERVGAAGIGEHRGAGLVLAVDEVITNALRHGGGGGTLRTWRDGDRAVCQVEGAGTISDPLVGRLRPSPDRMDGRGLWIANNVCDLVQIRSSGAGTVVRCHLGPAEQPSPL